MEIPIPPLHSRRPQNVLLFCAVLQKKGTSPENVERALLSHFGPIWKRSQCLDFSPLTSYYEDEMGHPLEKFLLCFQNPYPLETVFRTKLLSIQIEKSFCVDKKRPFNLDPGYLSLGKTHMLTTKDFAHRVYIQNGIYGEVNLIFSKKTKRYEPWERTYLDFRSPIFLEFLTECRDYYKNTILSHPSSAKKV